MKNSFRLLLLITLILGIAFTAASQLRITHVSPSAGVAGALIRIHGTAFSPSTLVEFSGVRSSGVTYMNPNLLLATVPQGVAQGWGTLVVHSGALASNARDFTILRPTAGNLVMVDQTPVRLPLLVGENKGLGDFTFADFTGDHAPELVISYGPRDAYLANGGAGAFTDVTASRLPPSFGKGGCAMGVDVDTDGDNDLLHLSYDTGLQLFRNDGNSVFTDVSANLPPGLGGRHYSAGDVDNDGDIDLVSARGNLLINDGSGQFTEQSGGRGVSAVRAFSVDLGDIDNDGDLDIAYGDGPAGTVLLFINDGTGTFTDETAARIPFAPEGCNRVLFADVDNDGDLDLFAPCYGGGYDQLFLNDGTGHFSNVTETNIPYRNDPNQAAACGDVDGDGDLDFVVCGRTLPIQLYVNDGHGMFTRAGTGVMPDLATDFRWVELADIDGDGHLDLGASCVDEATRVFVGGSDRVNRPPVLALPSSRVLVRTGSNVRVDISATDPDRDRLTFDAFNLPPRASLNVRTGDFHWNTRMDDQGIFDFFPYVRDTRGGMSMKIVPLVVADAVHDANSVQLLLDERGVVGLRPDLDGGYGLFPGHGSDSYIYASGPWVGGIVDGKLIVAHTAYTSEFVPSIIGTTGQPFHVFNSSSCEDRRHWPPEFSTVDGRPIIAPGAQNLVVEYNDVDGTPFYDVKQPLGIEIRQRSLAFDCGRMKDAVIFLWQIKNISDRVIQEAYFGYWGDFDIGYADDRAALVNDMAIMWDNDFSEAGFNHQPAIVGFDILETPAARRLASYTTFTNGGPNTDPNTDAAQYYFLSGLQSFETDFVSDDRAFPSTGPFTLNPGDSVLVAGAIEFATVPEGTTVLAVDPVTKRPDPNDPVLVELMRTQREVRGFYDARIRHADLAKWAADESGEAAAIDAPNEFRLEQNWPNPFNPNTGIRVQLSGDREMRLVVYDLLGREVAVLANGRYVAGVHTFTFDGSNLASGVYICHLTAGNFNAVRKMVLAK